MAPETVFFVLDREAREWNGGTGKFEIAPQGTQHKERMLELARAGGVEVLRPARG